MLNPVNATQTVNNAFHTEDKLKLSLTLSFHEKNSLKSEDRSFHFYESLMRKPFSETEADDIEKATYACLNQASQDPEKIIEHLEVIESLPDGCALSLLSACYKTISLLPRDLSTQKIKARLFEVIETKYHSNNKKFSSFDKNKISEDVQGNFISAFEHFEMDKLTDVGLKITTIAMPIMGLGIVSKWAFGKGYQAGSVQDTKQIPFVDLPKRPTAEIGLFNMGLLACVVGGLFYAVTTEREKLENAKILLAADLFKMESKRSRAAVVKADEDRLGLPDLAKAKDAIQYRNILRAIRKIDPRFHHSAHYNIPTHLPKAVRSHLTELITKLNNSAPGRTLESVRRDMRLQFSLVSDPGLSSVATPSRVTWMPSEEGQLSEEAVPRLLDPEGDSFVTIRSYNKAEEYPSISPARRKVPVKSILKRRS